MKLISADVCGTVMDSLSLQMARAAEAHAKGPMAVPHSPIPEITSLYRDATPRATGSILTTSLTAVPCTSHARYPCHAHCCVRHAARAGCELLETKPEVTRSCEGPTSAGVSGFQGRSGWQG